MKQTIELCKGCSVYQNCHEIENNETCPCIKCLVKMICEDGCIEYDKFERYHRKQREAEYTRQLAFQGKVMAR